MGRKTYKFMSLLDGSRIILGDKRAFGKDKQFYSQLEEELKDDWVRMQAAKSTERKTEFRKGEHVLVKSLKFEGLQRAIVVDVHGANTSLMNRSYYVFLYDEGDFEDIEEHRITVLSQARQQQLEPRSVEVRLTGIVPVKIVLDLAKKALNAEDDSAYIVTQDSSWTPRTNRNVEEWLKDRDIKYLGLVTSKTNEDGSVYGDIYRKLKSRDSQDQDTCTDLKEDDKSDDGKPGKKSKKDKYSLCEYIVEKKFALYNDDLAKSQLTVRARESRVGTNDAENAVSSKMVTKTSPQLTSGDELINTRHGFPQVPFSSRSVSTNIQTRETAGSSSQPLCIMPELVGSKGPPSTAGSTTSSLAEGDILPTGQCINTANDSDMKHRINIPGKLLVRGRIVRPPYKKTEEFQLNSNILKALDTLQITLSDLHKIVAPNFIRGSDLIVITADGGHQKGKNMRVLSYTLPILRLVYDKYGDNINGTEDGEPPETVIVVNSANTGANVKSYIEQLLNYSKQLALRVQFVNHKDAEPEPTQKHNHNYRKRLIPGGIAILILTMPYLSKVMQTTEGPRLFEKLRYLIFEESDMYLKKHKEDMLTFIDAARGNLKISATSLPFQITFSGSKWSAEMEDLYKEMVKRLEMDQVKKRALMVTISSPNQVVRYAKMNWKIHYVPEEETRVQKLNDVLGKYCLKYHRRIVIACSAPLIATKVHELITVCDGQQILLISSGMDKNALLHTLDSWRRNSLSVLVVSDDMMNKVDVSDATCLICFDSPEILIQGGVKRGLAAERFGYLWANIRHIEVEHSVGDGSIGSSSHPAAESSAESQELIAHFLMTGKEHNFYQMYKFANSLEREVEFPVELKQYAAMLEQAGKVNVEMCQGIRLFGFCNYADPETCPTRHFFSRDELSSTPSAPLTGEVEIRIIKCENPSSYRAELLRHFEFESGKRVCNHSYINDAKRRHSQLKKYYGSGNDEDGKAVKHLNSFDEGGWCAVKVKDPDQDYFARAKVGKVLQKNKFDEPITVRVYCIDSGLILNPAVDQLYVLPEEFQVWPPLVVNLILCNLKPRLGELEYRQSITTEAQRITTDQIYNAKIWLSIGNTIWVNPMVEYHVDSITKLPYRGDSVRMVLINKKLAEFSRSHLETLMASVNKYPGVYQVTNNVPSALSESSDEILMAKQEFHQIGDEIKWAFVGKSKRNKFDPAKIVTQYGYDPWMFFGVHDKYYSELKSLEKELHTCVEKYIDGTDKDKRFVDCKHFFTDNYYQVGMVVAARERIDQTWMRGLIMQKREEKCKNESSGMMEEYTEYEIFFVDYGDTCFDMTVDEIFPIPHTFVFRMPFQTIAFKLNHIEPLNAQEGWTESEKNAFLDIIVKDELSIDVELVALEDVYDSASSNPLPCRYYNALAFNEGSELGSILVQQGAAKLKPGSEEIIKESESNFLNFYNASVGQALASDDDGDEDVVADANYEDLEEIFDVHFTGSDVHTLLGIEKNGINFPDFSASISSLRNERQEILQQPALLPAPPLATPATPEPTPASSSTTTKVRTTVTPEPVEVKPTSSTKVSTPVPPVLKDGFLHPKVYWRQTESLFIMTVQLPDIKEYELKLLDDKSTINFKTLDKSPNYGFKIKVFGKLISEYSTHLTGQYMRVTFTKRMIGIPWIRPLFSKTEKFSWLKEDLDYIQDQDDALEECEDDQEAAIKESMAVATPKEDDMVDELLEVDDDDDNVPNCGDSDDDDDDDEIYK